ncbi:AzlC family ABC transporter permease [Desulfobacula sp.]|uniref:AzlC family ABC transporter permease n=1 Tax=Desulfobacula sp. TaxID=2593537 RepID=UPI0025C5FB6B|nr:AzlC family ABC transporter permease [Desulfobacula sp.]MBC2703690.1 AzlC family ABC transporter permease [Desulfobacula sp.]
MPVNHSRQKRGIAISPKNNSPVSLFFEGAKDTFPLIVGAIPFGIIFGTLAATAGLSFGATMGMSLFVFAGASQFVCVSLVTAGVAWPMIVLTTFVVNLRHMLYGATMVFFYKNLNPLWKMVLAFGLTDETFAVAVSRYSKNDGVPGKHYYNLGSMVFMYGNWNLCTFIGLTAGKAFPGISQWGLDFAMPATFIGIVIPYLVSKPMWASVITAGTVSILAGGLPHKLGLMMAALAGVAAGVICEKVFSEKKERI